MCLRLQVEHPQLWHELAFGKLATVRRAAKRSLPRVPAQSSTPLSRQQEQKLPLSLALRPFEVIIRPHGRYWCVEGDDGKTNGAANHLLHLTKPRAPDRESLGLLLNFSNAANAHANDARLLHCSSAPRTISPPSYLPERQQVFVKLTPPHAANSRRTSSFSPTSPASPAPMRCSAPSPLPEGPGDSAASSGLGSTAAVVLGAPCAIKLQPPPSRKVAAQAPFRRSMRKLSEGSSFGAPPPLKRQASSRAEHGVVKRQRLAKKAQ